MTHFDARARTFGDYGLKIERDVADTYGSKKRFSNVTEMLAMYNTFALAAASDQALRHPARAASTWSLTTPTLTKVPPLAMPQMPLR